MKKQRRRSFWNISQEGYAAIGVSLILVTGLLILAATSVSYGWLVAWTVLATLLIPVAALIGFWFGKVEVRGFLAGVDKKLDRLTVHEFRDGQPQPQEVLIRHRPQIAGGGEIIDVS